MSEIRIADSADDIGRCHAVMRELRPHIATGSEFAERVQRQRAQGYRLAFIERDRTLYVDDLVTREVDRSKRFGDELFDWLVADARANGCVTLELDSNVQRFAAHRFYLRKRMDIEAHHFRLKL